MLTESGIKRVLLFGFILISTMIFLSSCNSTKIVVTELNTIGKVVEIKKCNDCIDGQYIYRIELDPIEKEYMKYITDTKYNVGDMVYFYSHIEKEEN